MLDSDLALLGKEGGIVRAKIKAFMLSDLVKN